MPDLSRVQVTLDDHVLSLLTAGPEDGEPVVLLHGMPTGAELWRDVLSRLAAAGYRGLAPDLPGYGLTRVPARADHSLAGAAELVAAWVRRDFAGPVWVVGHDLGGAVAQILTVRHPDLVARLSLTNTVVDASWPILPIRLLRALATARLYPATTAAHALPNPYVRRELARGFADPSRFAQVPVRRIFFDGKMVDPEGRRTFARHLRALDAADTRAVVADLPGVRAPTQLVWGMADVFQPWARVGRRLESLLPRPHVTLLERCGHFTPLECPGPLTAAMLAFREGT